MTANGAITLSWGNSNDTSATYTTPENALDTEKVEFAGGDETAAELAALKPDGGLGLIDVRVTAPRNRAENRLANSQELVNPDTGTAGYRYIIKFKCSAWGSGSGMRRLRDWQTIDNTEGLYEHGRIGLKNREWPLYDIDPTDGRGWQIEGLDTDYDFSDRRMIGTLTLRFSGNPAVFRNA